MLFLWCFINMSPCATEKKLNQWPMPRDVLRKTWKYGAFLPFGFIKILRKSSGDDVGPVVPPYRGVVLLPSPVPDNLFSGLLWSQYISLPPLSSAWAVSVRDIVCYPCRFIAILISCVALLYCDLNLLTTLWVLHKIQTLQSYIIVIQERAGLLSGTKSSRKSLLSLN